MSSAMLEDHGAMLGGYVSQDWRSTSHSDGHTWQHTQTFASAAALLLRKPSSSINVVNYDPMVPVLLLNAEWSDLPDRLVMDSLCQVVLRFQASSWLMDSLSGNLFPITLFRSQKKPFIKTLLHRFFEFAFPPPFLPSLKETISWIIRKSCASMKQRLIQPHFHLSHHKSGVIRYRCTSPLHHFI